MVKTGGTFIFRIAAMSNVAQGGATLAVLLVTRDEKPKGRLLPLVFPFIGITEPAMFGVNLKLRYPLIGAIAGSAVAGIYYIV